MDLDEANLNEFRMATVELHAVAVAQIRRGLAAVPRSADEEALIDKLAALMPEDGYQGIFDVFAAHDIALTPIVWIELILALTAEWNERGQDNAVALPDLRELYPSHGEPLLESLIDKASAALCALGWAAYKEREDEGSPAALMSSFHGLALAFEALDNVDKAYDMDAMGLQLGPGEGVEREKVLRHSLALAIDAGRMHQIAICSAALGETIAAAADQLPARRLEAFTACEIALERLALTPKPFQQLAAEVLMRTVLRRDYLEKLRLPVFWFLPESARPKELPLAELPLDRWPERISRESREGWLKGFNSLSAAQTWDWQLDKARLALEPEPVVSSFEADWFAWTIDHPAYRRAIPHNQSFLREENFNRHLLVLSHETTHVLSLLGPIGTALVALRIATMDSEITLWSVARNIPREQLAARISAEGVAPIEPGAAASLFRTEQALELTIKAQILQDVWTPWLEGLAVFGESACDPALDPVGIGPVIDCLRHLVDFHPPADEKGVFSDIEKMMAAYEKFNAEFEARCTKAVAERGPIRLETYLPLEPYFQGYVAVRGVVAAWRAATGRALTSTEAFGLLLHATRYGTLEALPDLALGRESFEKEAFAKMQAWMENLAGLGRDDIEEFLRPPERDGPGRIYHWSGGRPAESGPDIDMEGKQKEAVTRMLQAALSSLSNAADIDRLGDTSKECRLLLTFGANAISRHANEPRGKRSLESYVDRHFELMLLGGLLPIGRADAKFHLNADQAAATGHIATQLRTTEAHIDTGQPSMNSLWFPVDHAASKQIIGHFQRSGNPRVHVTRVIDLAGIVAREPSLHGLHLFAFSYGDWFELVGPTQAMSVMLSQDTDYRSTLTELVRARIQPNDVARAELTIMARGLRGAERTRDWIDRSGVWCVGDQAVDVGDWVSHVRKLAEQVSDNSIRRSRQVGAARVMMNALFADQAFTANIVDHGFRHLTDQCSQHRSDIVAALFRSAQKPVADRFLEQYAAEIEAAGFSLFRPAELGWDVRPAVTGA